MVIVRFIIAFVFFFFSLSGTNTLKGAERSLRCDLCTKQVVLPLSEKDKNSEFPKTISSANKEDKEGVEHSGNFLDQDLAKMKTELAEILDQYKPGFPDFDSALDKYQKKLDAYVATLSESAQMDAILKISREITLDASDEILLSLLLKKMGKDHMLVLMKKMYHIPINVIRLPLSVYLYHIGISQEELLSIILGEENLHPDAIASIAKFIHEYQFGVFLVSQPLSGKVPLSEAARRIYGNKQ